MVKAKSKRPRYDSGMKELIVRAAQAGKSYAELSKEYGPSTLSIRNWVKAASGHTDTAEPSPDTLQVRRGRKPAGANPDLARLQAENVKLRQMVKALVEMNLS